MNTIRFEVILINHLVLKDQRADKDAADDVVAIVADVALAAPRNGIVEIAGPERAPFNEFVARYLKAVGDPRSSLIMIGHCFLL